MSLKTRFALLAGAAMAAALLLVSLVIYIAIRAELRGQIDRALEDRAGDVARSAQVNVPLARRVLRESKREFPADVPPPRLGGRTGLAQLVLLDGAVLRPSNQSVAIPTNDETLDVATGQRGEFFSDMRVEGGRIRVLTTPLFEGVALQVAFPLDEVDQFLRRLILILGSVMVVGTVMAAGLGRVVASTALSPVRDLTHAAEKVAVTKDLAHRIAREGSDELGRLASSFNAMLEALDASLAAQRQLVADASHELRTPLTSLRTNIEVLAKTDALAPGEKDKLLRDVVGELDELTVLMSDLIELARGDEPDAESEEVRLDLLTEGAVRRAQRHWPNIRFVSRLSPSSVQAIPLRVERAIMNLLDNAAKWSPQEGEVEVTVSDGEVRVRDQGPGISASDLPYVFDRFYRAADARGMTGSGIGLAIVRQVATSHGGSVRAENADGGGAILKLALPTIS
jgi:two-component system sensor histidine kinase MprB